jgi:hypothetical protein
MKHEDDRSRFVVVIAFRKVEGKVSVLISNRKLDVCSSNFIKNGSILILLTGQGQDKGKQDELGSHFRDKVR